MQNLIKYFPELSEEQMSAFEKAKQAYIHWNEQINVISRKDIDQFEIRHLLHSLAIAKFVSFKPGTQILDFGTGGGFPGIPLAIFFPEVQFTLIDSIAKKMKVVSSIAEELELKNVRCETGRVEQLKGQFDFVTCRAVGRLTKIMPWVRKSLKKDSINQIPNGYIFLKGGDLDEEISEIKMPVQRIRISSMFEQEFFETKEIVYLSEHLKN